MASSSQEKLTIGGYHDIEVSVKAYGAEPVDILLPGSGLSWWTSLGWDDWDRLVAFVNWRRAETAKERREAEKLVNKVVSDAMGKGAT